MKTKCELLLKFKNYNTFLIKLPLKTSNRPSMNTPGYHNQSQGTVDHGLKEYILIDIPYHHLSVLNKY